MRYSFPIILLGLLAAFAAVATAGTTLSSLNPPYIQAGGPDVTLSISGSGFVPGGVVVFGYAGASLSTTYIDSTRISAVLPASISALSGDYQVFVRNPDSSASSTLYFDIQPVLTSVTPNSVAAGSPTTPVTITGIGFVDGISVRFVTASSSTGVYASYVNSTKMTAFIDASLLTTPGAATIQVIDLDYPNTSTLPFTITSGPAVKATLTSLVPASVTQGTSTTGIQVNGSGFANGCTAQWNGTPLSTILINASQLSVQIPTSLTALPGSASITVVNPGAPASNALTFTVTAQSANARSLSPSSATAGGPAFTLTVNGGGLQNSIYSGAVVQWNGTPLVTTFVSSTQLTAQVPASLIATPGTANVTIVNPSANPSLPAVFTILPASPPTLTSLSPTSATVGSSGITLTISGSNFTSGATVLWNGSSLATTFVSSGQLTAQVTANLLSVAGAATISVYEVGPAASNTLTFTVSPLSAPTLAAISPTFVTAGSPGFTLTVTGTAFVASTAIQWNGSPIATTFVSSTQLTAQIPASLVATGGTAAVRVANSSASVSNSLTFTIATPPPAISSLSPGSAASGSPAFPLTVNGSGFVSSATVQWNGSPLATTFVGATQLTAQVPATAIAAAGSASVKVVNPGGAPSNAVTFTITAPATPTISNLAPSTATAGGLAFTLTVTGSNFIANSIVFWNGASLPTTFISSTQLTAQVAASRIAAPGGVSVLVSNGTGANNAAATFTVLAAGAPTLASLSPADIAAGSPAFSLTVNGSGFVSGAAVQWNGSPLTTAFVSATQLTAQVPASDVAAAGSATVTVFNTGSVASNVLTFTVSPGAPTLGSLSPSIAAASGPAFSLAVNGSGFVSGATVQWNGSPLATTFVIPTQLTAQVPASAISAAGSANVTVLNPGSAASNALNFTISPASSTLPIVQGILNAASYTHALAPGTWATIFGQQLAVSTASAQNVPLPLTLAEVKSVTVGNVQAPLSYVSPGQINFVVPFEAALGASVPVVVTTSEGASVPVNITLVRNAPALFTQNAQGTGMAIAFNSSFQPVTSVGSDAIILYAVGLGPTNPPPASSAQGGASTEPLNRVADQVQVFIGEVPCQVQFAGLAPGFPGIYQLNVIPPQAPLSNRLYIAENGVTGNVTTLSIPVGTNVTNVQGSIDGLYPASGTYASQLGATQPTSGPVSFSEMLNAGAATVSFDIRPNAQPFTVVAMGPGATAVLQIDPTDGTWQGYATLPTQVARVGDFSGYSTVVYDLLSGTPFPGNIIPVSRFDPIEFKAAGLLPIPNVFPTTPSPNATFAYASRPLMQSGHFSIGSGQASDDLSNLYFGGFVNIGQPPPSSQTAEFLLFVDGMLVATKDVSYPVQ